MKYRELKKFIEKNMRMAHVYQPVMLMTLLENGGKCLERLARHNPMGNINTSIYRYSKYVFIANEGRI